ncbi:MAG TPA: efflux RND transporter periplasmic adaptor subunit [Cytophagaceae bacterium]|jgi:cobalt-zinc-cadmium efflux system membrane fusion protein|nr:efflux RND transporter periplasmic adaptor subunit [Cytophagaceae bacterium]
MKRTVLYAAIVVFTLSCHHKKEQEEEVSNFVIKGDTILLSDQSGLASKIKVDQVAHKPYRLQITSAATVKAIPNKYVQIAPPFSGRVLQSNMRLGQKVEPGSELFQLSSPAFIDAQKLFFQAKSQYKLAEQNLKRQKDLLQNGVGIEKDLEEAESNFEVQKKEYENTLAGMKIFVTNPESLVLGQPLVVRSPIKGEIIVNNIVVGQYLKNETEPVAIVAELSKVWVTGMVKEKDIRFIEENDEVEIELIAYPGETIKGKVFHISQQVDEITRAVEVFVECDNVIDANKHQKLKPGMYATVKFIDSPENIIMIPVKSLMQDQNKNFVFVQLGPNKYVKRYVTTGNSENGNIIITKGLQIGEAIIVEGGFYLLGAK